MRHVRHVHFVGIGGSGMCGIAEVLINQRFTISGSDLEDGETTRRLANLGAKIFIGHSASNVEGADVLVASSAIADTNPEVARAHTDFIPVIPRAEMLGELMRNRFGIAVAGTHGKTTTTSMITSIFQAAKLDPTYVIGGLLKSAGRYASLGQSKYLVAEADESDASFLYLKPMMAVITNIDHDHLATYSHDFKLLCDTFLEFVARLPFYGAVICCYDDEHTRALIPDISRPVLTYGLSEGADFRAVEIESHTLPWSFRCHRPKPHADLEITLSTPGLQNVSNALAAIAVATDENIADKHIQAGLAAFLGVGRRFDIKEMCISESEVTMVDDYGHHPTEVSHILTTVRTLWPKRRTVMVYQPHRFSRTSDLFNEFVEVLAQVDVLILLETYAAGEASIENAGIDALADAIGREFKLEVQTTQDAGSAAQAVKNVVQQNDVVLIQGAGNVSRVAELLAETST